MRPSRLRSSLVLGLAVFAGLPSLSSVPARAEDGPGLFARIFKRKDRNKTAPAVPPPPPMSRPGPNGPANDFPQRELPPFRPPVEDDAPAPFVSRGEGPARAPLNAPTSLPLLTRASVVRSQDGQRFGVFLQVHADGTVLDAQGPHKVERRDLQPVLQAIQACDPANRKGHCGGPGSEFLESVHFIAYETVGGHLRAHPFSASGDLRRCDAGLQRLQAALDELAGKLAPPVNVNEAPAPAVEGPAPALVPGNDEAAPPPPLLYPVPVPPSSNPPPPPPGDGPALSPPDPGGPRVP